MALCAVVLVNGQPRHTIPMEGFRVTEGGRADSVIDLDIPLDEFDRIQMVFVNDPFNGPAMSDEDAVEGWENVTFTLQIAAMDEEDLER